MPVSCYKDGDKWECKDKNGKVHGTHESEDKCKAQARAINANLELSDVNVLTLPKDTDFKMSGEPLVFEKEHIYVSQFHKGDVKFEITQDTLMHFANETNKYNANGNKSALPLEHDGWKNPEKNRGECYDWEVKEDSKGRMGLFSKVKFANEDAAKLAKTAQTSIFAPPSHKDGLGNEYNYPIRHVALTDVPVVPGLDGFEAVCASLFVPTPEPKPKGGNAMAFKELCGKLDITLSESADETTAEKAVQDHVRSLQSQVVQLSETKKEYEKYRVDNPPKAVPTPVSANQIGMIAENRDVKLSNLVQDAKITPAVKRRLKDLFCTDQGLNLVLSEDFDDKFDELVDCLRENEALKLLESSHAQVRDSSMEFSENNPLQRVAAQAAEKKRIQFGYTQ